MHEDASTDAAQPHWRPVEERESLVEAQRWFDRHVKVAIGAGLLGALSIVAFFFVIDLLQGRPFHTPAMLGSVVFLAEPYAAGAPLPWAAIWGYTVLHGVVFVSMALLASMVVPSVIRLGRSFGFTMAGMLYAFALFVLLQVFFYVFDFIMLDAQAGRLGDVHVAMANLLAAGVMALTLQRSGERVATESDASAS